jgi:hypothetical protein
MVMDTKKTTASQEPTPDAQQPQPLVAPVLSNLNDIQDVENETPPVEPLKFNTVADGIVLSDVSPKWRYFFIAVAVLELLALGLVLQTIATADQRATATGTNAEVIILYSYLMFVLPAAILAVANLITLPIYIVKAKPQKVALVCSIASLIVSVAIVVFAMLAFLG